MSRSRSARSARTLGLVSAVALAASAPAGAQGPASADVRDLRLPVLDLDLPVTSLDGSVGRSEGDGQTRITLSADVLFRFARADLSARARSRLADVAADIRAARPERVTIVGHTDAKGGDAANRRLSRRRADAVRRALAQRLGGGPVLTTSGRGEEDPVAKETTEDGEDDPRGRSRNRRVEIRIPRR